MNKHDLLMATLYGLAALLSWFISISAMRTGVYKSQTGQDLTEKKNPTLFGWTVFTKVLVAIAFSLLAIGKIVAAFALPSTQ